MLGMAFVFTLEAKGCRLHLNIEEVAYGKDGLIAHAENICMTYDSFTVNASISASMHF